MVKNVEYSKRTRMSGLVSDNQRTRLMFEFETDSFCLTLFHFCQSEEIIIWNIAFTQIKISWFGDF